VSEGNGRLPNEWEQQHWNAHDGGAQSILEALTDPDQRTLYRQAQLAERIRRSVRGGNPDQIERLIAEHLEQSKLAGIVAAAIGDEEQEQVGCRMRLLEVAGLIREQIADKRPPTEILGLVQQCMAELRDFNKQERPFPMTHLSEIHKELREPVIRGLVRRGETLNIIAPPKVGKSWLVTDLALHVVMGLDWLGMFPTAAGAALVVDNELHAETSTHRIQAVANARAIKLDQYGDKLFVENVRGRLRDIHAMASYFAQFQAGQFRVVILDAMYRFLPAGVSENDNAEMAQVYNAIDRYAAQLDCCFVCIHHSTKGSQTNKAVVDVGAGAGSQSRAADCHLVLRAHERESVYVVDGVTRSFKPIEPFCIQRNHPLWNPALDLDPALLKPDKPPRKKAEPKADTPKELPWTAERFTSEFITAEPQHRLAIIDAALYAGLSDRRAEKLLKSAVAKKPAFAWINENDRRQALFANVQQPPKPAPETVNQEAAESAR
jgi:hypothetical protein